MYMFRQLVYILNFDVCHESMTMSYYLVFVFMFQDGNFFPCFSQNGKMNIDCLSPKIP